MSESTNEDGARALSPTLVASAFTQACEKVRHIRNERIWFANAYTAVVAGGLALLKEDIVGSASRVVATPGLVVLVLFSVVSLLSSIRLVVELRSSITNLQHLVVEIGMNQLVGEIEPTAGLAGSLPVRWVFPIFFGITTLCLVTLLVIHLVL